MLGTAVIFLLLSCNTLEPNKYPNMVADADPFSVGTAEVEFDRPFSSKVNKVVIEAIFHPRLNAVSLEFKYQLLKYRQFWDSPARKQFAASLELYKRDFEDRKLIDNYRKTRDIYGRTKGRVEWEAFKFTKTRVANPTIELGYRYKENTPFFATLMRGTKEETSELDNSATNSAQINMYFTRAQADEMAKLFDQDYLMELLKKKDSVVIDEPSAEEDAEPAPPKDPYREYGE